MIDAIRPSAALQNLLFPHETEQRAGRADEGRKTSALGPRGRRPRGGPSGPPLRLTEHFRPNTCPRCHHITVAGIWLGFRVDLEPTVLDDLGEYQALVDEVTTWNLWPDMIARPRTVASILHPNVTDRHAEHSCAATYGTLHPTPRPHPTAAPVSDAPPF